VNNHAQIAEINKKLDAKLQQNSVLIADLRSEKEILLSDLELLQAVTANNTSLVDAYFKNMIGRGPVQGTINVLDGIMQRGDSTMDEYQQRVKDIYLGYADEPFKNQKALYKKAREQGRQRKAIQFGPPEDEETTTETPAKKWTQEELVNLQKTNPEEFERVIGGK
jgi:hypothetical protein